MLISSFHAIDLFMWRDAATPDTVNAHPHLVLYARLFPDFDSTAHTMVLLGRDCGEDIASQLLNDGEPYLHSASLDMALVGNICVFGKNVFPCCLQTNKVLRSIVYYSY